MNILFLTIVRIKNIAEKGIYTDLIRKFRDEGHNVYIVSPSERRYNEKTKLFECDGEHILNVKTLNLQKTNLIEKGIGTLMIEGQYLLAIKKHLPSIKFDLVLYSTPPITFTKVIEYIKKRNNAKSYLLLKDIFPQNAVDLGFMKEKSLIHKYFKAKEKQLYEVSDYIGCMSKANVKFIKRHNPAISEKVIEVNPNSIEPKYTGRNPEEKKVIREKYGIPINSRVFVYGGNLGKPQGIDFLIDVLEANKNNDAFFVIVGSGTEYSKIEEWINLSNPNNSLLIPGLPKKEYDNLVQACEVGLIFLDRRFTIPNYPSRLLSYMENKMPIIAATDPNTDIGKEAEEHGYGFWCESGDLESMNQKINLLTQDASLVESMGEKGYEYLIRNFTVSRSYSIIMNHFQEEEKEAMVSIKNKKLKQTVDA